MSRWLATVAILVGAAACDAPSGKRAEPAVVWQYAPAPIAWDVGAPKGRFGRGVAPTPLVSVGVSAAKAEAPLDRATALPVPGDGPARAVAYGFVADATVVELIDVDAGRVLWRDRDQCGAPVVGVTAKVAVCSGANGTRAIGWDGKQVWHSDHPFLAMTDDRIAALIGNGVVAILDADDGGELARVTLPAGVDADSVLATCGDAGRELFVALRDGRLARIAEGKGGAAIAWAVEIPDGGYRATPSPPSSIGDLDACGGATVLVSNHARTLFAIARDSGRVTGHVERAIGSWPSRTDDRIELSTAAGVGRYARDLASPPEMLALPPLGALIASRGDRRLVAAGAGTAALLDRAGLRAYVQLAPRGGVLGERAVLADAIIGDGSSLTRWLLPAGVRRAARVPRERAPTVVPAELRDLPPVEPLAEQAPIALPGAGDTASFALDPADGATLYVVGGAALSRVDLRGKRIVWSRPDACGEDDGEPAVAAGAVLCNAGTRGKREVRATTLAGAPAWIAQDAWLDPALAAGDAIVLQRHGGFEIVDPATGRSRGALASDDGGRLRAALVVVDGTTYLFVAERGRLVARLPDAGLIAAWSLAVDGHVSAIHAAGDAVLVELDGGDAYRIDARGGAVIPLPALGVEWSAYRDVLVGAAPGGPLYDAPAAAPAPKKAPLKLPLGPARALPPLDDPGPPMSTPVETPASTRTAWQLALYEPTGGVRARSEYALDRPVDGQASYRGPSGSALIVTGTPPDGREVHARDVLVLDPRTGDPLRRLRMPAPDDTLAFDGFSTIVDGKPVIGSVRTSPLRVVTF